MVFNTLIETRLRDEKMSTDKELIEAAGGSSKVAALLGCSVQRVQNWKDRGIPAQVRLDHPDVFPLPEPKKHVSATADAEPR